MLGLIEGKSVAGVWDLLDTDPRVDVAELTVRRRRANPRVIKRKMPRWHVKRARHRNWPQPRPSPATATIRAP